MRALIRQVLAAAVLFLLTGGGCFAAGDSSAAPRSLPTTAAQRQSEIEALIRKIETQIAEGHTISPEHDNALESWRGVIQRSIPASPGIIGALTDFVARLHRRAAEEKAAGTTRWIDFDVFAFTTSEFIAHAGIAPASPSAELQSGATSERAPGATSAGAMAGRDPASLREPGNKGPGRPEDGAAATTPRPLAAGSPAATAGHPSPGVADTSAGSSSNLVVGAAEPAPGPPPRATTQQAAPETAAAAYASRGDDMLAVRDISAARKFYQHAANAGSARAATALARTYDPDFLARLGVVGARPDPGLALSWYRRGAAMGDPDAKARLYALTPEARTPDAATTRAGRP